jgi:putative hydrolase of the HAD superfamily
MRFAEIDAVTLDANGTLLELVDPAPALDDALRARGVERSAGEIRAAFRAEAEYYRARSSRGRDAASLAALRRDCTAVFLDALDGPLDADEFAAAYVACLRFQPADGVRSVLPRLRARGVALAVVSNWDVGLHDYLADLGLTGFFTAVVTSAEAGARKPDAALFEEAVRRLAVAPARAIHVGDERVDEEGARAAEMRFAPAPLTTAFDGWT